MQFPDIIFFAIVAAFLIFRLRSVLGRRTGNERQRPDPFRPSPADHPGAAGPRTPAEPAGDKVIPLPPRPVGDTAPLPPAAKGTPLEAGLTQISVADPSFTPQGFLEGAKVAFEMIVDGFAKGNRKALRPLLNNAVFEQFSDAIKAREDASQHHETTLVAIKEADVIEARMEGRTAFVTVKLASEQVNVTRDKDGHVVDGDPSQVVEIADIWTFARNTRSNDPNWTLVETRSPN